MAQDYDQVLARGTEGKLARKLGISVDELRTRAIRRWGRSITAERDARMVKGDRSAQAQRGHIMRRLLRELNEPS